MVSGEQVRINIIGQGWSGKSTLVKKLAKDYGFDIFRPSDVIREFARANGIVLNGRKAYVDTYVEMLHEDPDSLIRAAIDNPEPRLAIDGMRAPRDVMVLRQRIGMRTLALDCSAEVRYIHMLNSPEERQKRDGDHIQTFEEFIADEVIDNGNEFPFMPNVEQIIKMADIIIDASQPEDKVHRQAESYVAGLLGM